MFRGVKIKKNCNPLVSVNIPTYNEESSLPLALKALKRQNYSEIEVIVVDSNSNDNTKEIASKFDAKVINYNGKLLGARYIGLNESKGDYVLFLDADQILKEDVIQRAVEKIIDFDMLIFEEDSYKPKTYIQNKISEERKVINSEPYNLDPLEGSLLPRFFKRIVLEDAFKNIPDDIYPIVVAHDHAIIYYEAYQLYKNIGILNNAVSHIEPESFFEVLKHFYRFGQSTKALDKTGYYQEIYTKKTNIKKNSQQVINNNILIMSLFRSLSYRIGYYFG